MSPGLRVSQTREQRDRARERLLLLLGEALGNRLYEPALTLLTLRLERLSSLIGQLKQDATPIGRIGPAADQSVSLEFADSLSHRLRTNTFSSGQVTGANGPFAVETSKHGAVRQREAMLGSQSPHQLAKHYPQFAGDKGHVDGQGHETIYGLNTGKLYRLPV